MIAFTTAAAVRTVASPSTLDAAQIPFPWVGLRIAPDELMLVPDPTVRSSEPGHVALQFAVDDEHALTEPDAGYSIARLIDGEFEQVVRPHIDWAIPSARPALAQGLVAGVPCKLWFADDEVLILCLTAHVHELEARL